MSLATLTVVDFEPLGPMGKNRNLKSVVRIPSCPQCYNVNMDLQDAQSWLDDVLREVSVQFSRVPGSAIFLRYVKSSYQNDPVRSAVELFLVLFAIRYLMSPKYSTQKKSYVTLSDEACHPSMRLRCC